MKRIFDLFYASCRKTALPHGRPIWPNLNCFFFSEGDQ